MPQQVSRRTLLEWGLLTAGSSLVFDPLQTVRALQPSNLQGPSEESLVPDLVIHTRTDKQVVNALEKVLVNGASSIPKLTGDAGFTMDERHIAEVVYNLTAEEEGELGVANLNS